MQIKFTLIALALIVISGLVIYVQKKYSTNKPGTVIILNGPSAVGKTSIVKAFQTHQEAIWLGMGIDTLFVGILPSKVYLDSSKPQHRNIMEGFSSEDSEGKLFTLKIGAGGDMVVYGMNRAIAEYAQTGNNVIVDYIAYKKEWIDDLKKSLEGIPTIFVGITASLATIAQREKTRATSPEGHGRSLYTSVHKGISYDLMIDTDKQTPEEAADQISIFIKNKK